MREGRQLVRETSRFAIEERARSWWNLVPTVGLFVAALGVASAHLPWGVRLLASIVAALTQVRLFVIYHDYLHGAIFQDSRIADILFRFYGLVVLSPASVWRQTHDHHHINNARRLGIDSVGTYPMLTTQAYQEADRATRFFYAFSRHPINMALGYLTVFFFSLCVKPTFTDPRRHKDAVLAVVLHLSVVIPLGIFRPDVLVFAIFIPWFLSSALGSYLFYAQHNYPGVKIRPDADWDYVVAALHSSSFIRMSPVMHWFTANIGYHHVHHLNSRIPFYRLPEAMAAIDELRSPVTTSLRPADIVRCFRLNLWDPEKDRLVSYAEARDTQPTTAAVN